MAKGRRNLITREDSLLVALVAAVSGVVATLAGCEPTGETVPDIVLTFAVAAFTTWAAAQRSVHEHRDHGGVGVAGRLQRTEHVEEAEGQHG